MKNSSTKGWYGYKFNTEFDANDDADDNRSTSSSSVRNMGQEKCKIVNDDTEV